MEATITFSENCANIQFPNKDISSTFITSQNGKYHLLSDTLFSDNSDKTAECVVVFTDTEVIYYKKLSGDSCISNLQLCKVFNNGSCAFFTDDDNFIVLDADGKQQAKRKTPEGIEHVEYIGKYVWGVGSDGESSLIWLFSFLTMKATKKELPHFCVPDAEVEVLELSSDDADIIRVNDHFIIGYADGSTCAAYDFEFSPVRPSDIERDAVFSAQRQRIAKEQAHKERKRAEREAYARERNHLQ
ncbi:MAG: hypothetical protein KHY77_02490 [Butyricicoccus pullicaecorum]|nr:hypothetical protein [Butyricicoccus pullicaecorum]